MEIQIAKLPRIRIQKKRFNKLPESCGVYIFWAKNEAIYIGKALNLKSRLLSYLTVNLSPKTKSMVHEAQNVSFIKVNSELESLLLEAYLVRKNQPKYNAALKDDKHPLYIRITKEDYPRVITARKIDQQDNLAFYGPFPNSRNVYSVLKMLRRIFPFSDHKLGKRGCLYNHIGLCNPCPSEIERITNRQLQIMERKKYLHNIRMIKMVLSRKIKSVATKLGKEMDSYSKNEKFEEAEEVYERIKKLEYITQPTLPIKYFVENPNLYEDLRAEELNALRKLLASHIQLPTSIHRIECFDVAHLSGTSPAASMVTFINGEADKNLYRHFKIRQEKSRDDVSSIGEVAKRRLRHPTDWGVPNLIIVDGGVGQVNAFTSILYSNEVDIPIVGIAKNPDRLIVGGKKIRLKGPALNLVVRVRNEAHRFARRYHHKLVKKSLIY